ncbi:type VI secretion system Vgr family protein [Enterobacter hormaechei]|nr:phage late control D family protein [Enterobacter hormaechei]EJK8936928.1 phage late control D family protein [Enterobacter hormaechei]EKS6614466.1 phage late control D family protein [Enterobacter hormaechei]EKU3254882.1 phage late control D family protein [Enterobacter hormaechei]EKV5717686.1 phage late control D family protein [Enterobacter hormaechei]EKV8297557.1 phage late control D family protein [Enterobacter hormaechei]
MAGQSDTVQQQDTLNRYLLYFPRSETVSPDVHSFCGEEELSKPYRYTIRFTSPNPNIAVKDVLNKMAEFILRAPNPKAKSTWHNQESWLPVRQINGVITSFSRLKSSADEALYECMLEHELALLDRNYRSAVYMDMTVPELVTKLMKESGHFQGYNIDFDQLSHNYPSREMIIQWKETDLQFIRRLLAEVGIWFRFENHDKVQGETVVIFGDGSRRYVFSNKKLPYVRHSGMTSHEEYVTELEERYQLIPENVLVRTYNYRDPFSPQADKTIAGNDIPHGITRGKQYHYADHFLAAGDFYGQEAETASFYARLRYERLLNKQSVLGVTTSDPELLPGVMFHPTGDIPDGFKPGFLVTTMTLSGCRAQHYRAILKGIPYLNGYSYTDTKQGVHSQIASQFYRIFTKRFVHPSERYIAIPWWGEVTGGFSVSKDYGQTWERGGASMSPGENEPDGSNAPYYDDVLSFTVVNDQGFLQTKHRLYMSSKPFDDPRLLPGGAGIQYKLGDGTKGDIKPGSGGWAWGMVYMTKQGLKGTVQELQSNWQDQPDKVPEVKGYTGWDHMQCNMDEGR